MRAQGPSRAPGPTTTSPPCTAQLKSHGTVARLGARDRDLRSRLLQPPAEAVPRLSARPGWSSARSRKVNWDPVDSTVLANEQVIDGRGWRSGALVEQRELTQWFFKITDYSRRTCSTRSTALDRWPEKVRLMQKNWIGRSRRAAGPLRARPATTPDGDDELEIFTTRPDTLFGASFMAHRAGSSAGRGSGDEESGARRLHRRMPAAWAPRRRRSRRPRSSASTPASRVAHPFDPRLDAAGLRRQFHADGLRHRRDLRLPGARPARSRFRSANTASAVTPVVLPARRRTRRPSSSPTTAYDGDGTHDQFALPRRA